MARLIPDVTDGELRSWRSPAEAEVYRAFRRLSDHIVVIHSLPTLVPGGQDGPPRDGEADFVVLDPDEGFLVIEVKGGGVAYDPTTNTWTRPTAAESPHRISDPFAQARDRKHDILRLLRNAAGQAGRRLGLVRSGHAVLFPDLDDIRDVSRPDAPPQVVGGREAVGGLEEWIADIWRFWAGQEPTTPFWGTQGVLDAERVLCSAFVVEPRLGTRFQRESQVCAYWTDAQWQTLRGLRHWPRAGVAGGAGTGKTLLAMRRAQELAASGRKTLMLCFNAALGDCLKRENLAYIEGGHASRDALHTLTFHEFCAWWVQRIGQQTGRKYLRVARAAYPGQSEFDVQMPAALAYALEHARPAYDAIIIDEGQDFADEFWLPIALMAESAETLTIFYDPNQTLFRASPRFPIAPDRTYYLTRNCRSTAVIHEAAYRHYLGPEVDAPDLPGVPLRLWPELALLQQAHKIATELQGLIRGERIAPHDIAVLVLDSRRKRAAYDALQSVASLHRVQLAEEHHDTTGRVLLDTVARFKGLEAAVVILWLNGTVDGREQRQLLYVGLSRPRFLLGVVGTHEQCEMACQPQPPGGPGEPNSTSIASFGVVKGEGQQIPK